MPEEFLEGVFKLRHTKDNKHLIHSLYGEIEDDYNDAMDASLQ